MPVKVSFYFHLTFSNIILFSLHQYSRACYSCVQGLPTGSAQPIKFDHHYHHQYWYCNINIELGEPELKENRHRQQREIICNIIASFLEVISGNCRPKAWVPFSQARLILSTTYQRRSQAYKNISLACSMWQMYVEDDSGWLLQLSLHFWNLCGQTHSCGHPAHQPATPTLHPLIFYIKVQFTTSSRRLDGGAYCGAPVGGKCMVSKAKLVLYAFAV